MFSTSILLGYEIMYEGATIDARTCAQATLEEYTSSQTISVLGGERGVQIRPASDASVCGAAGCQETAQLLRGTIEGIGQRVLCAEHLAGLIQREVQNR